MVSVATLGSAHSAAAATTSASKTSSSRTHGASSTDGPVIGPRLRFSGLGGLGTSFGEADPSGSVRDIMPTPLLLGAEAAWGPIPVSLGANLALAVAYYTNVKRNIDVEGEEVSSSSRSVNGETHTWLLLAAHATFDVAL